MSDPQRPISQGVTPAHVEQLLAQAEALTNNPATGAELLGTVLVTYLQKYFGRPGPDGFTGKIPVTVPNRSISMVQPQTEFHVLLRMEPAVEVPEELRRSEL